MHNNGGWELANDEKVNQAYEEICDKYGTDWINEQIIRAISTDELGECLCYIGRMHDLRDINAFGKDEEQ